jgi:hypothetical protein
MVHHRLMAPFSQIDNREPGMTKDAFPRIIRPDALIIRATVADPAGQFPNALDTEHLSKSFTG